MTMLHAEDYANYVHRNEVPNAMTLRDIVKSDNETRSMVQNSKPMQNNQDFITEKLHPTGREPMGKPNDL